MIQLMVVNDNYAEPNPELRAIPVFRDIITRDRGSEGDSQGRKKLQATREFAWIWYMYDPTSPYQVFEEEERYAKAGNLVFDNTKYKPDKKLREAADRYREMCDTLQVRMLTAAKEASRNIIKYLKNVDLTAEDEKGKPKHKVNDVMKALEKIGEVTDSLENLEERVRRQKEKEQEIRGGVKLNKFSA